jgi:hypothetical protein
MPSPRRLPPPWSVEEQSACFVVRDHNGQALAYVYFEDEPGRRSAAKLLSKDEARRIASNITKVLPLDASIATRMVTPRPSMSGGRKLYTYTGVPVTGQPRGTGPDVLDTSYTITADIEVPQGGGDGMIVTDGGRFGGYGLYLLKGKPVFLWNLLDLKRVRWEGSDVLTAGKHTLEYDFKYDGLGLGTLAYNSIRGLGRGGSGTFKVDGKVVSTQALEHTVPLTLPWDETFDIGSDSGTPVDDHDYQVPFAFNGKINKLTFSIAPPVLTEADKSKLQEAYRAAQDAN